MYFNNLSKMFIYFLLSLSVDKSKSQTFLYARSLMAESCNQIPSNYVRMKCLESLREATILNHEFDDYNNYGPQHILNHEFDDYNNHGPQHITNYGPQDYNNYGPQHIKKNYNLKNVPCGVVKQKTRRSQTKIVGGSDAAKGEFPWLVSIQIMNKLKFPFKFEHHCGGAIIHEHYIITAAHCVSRLRPHQLSVVTGEHKLDSEEGDEERFSVEEISVPHNFENSEPFPNDIALLRVSFSINFDGYLVAPICLPSSSAIFGPGINGTVSGWGKLNEDDDEGSIKPKKIIVPITDKQQCQKAYAEEGLLNECQFCASAVDKDSCQGDSGGPMACKQSDGLYYLCGIVSWGRGCARRGYPGVYTHVPCYNDYIRKIIN